jgi:hypothetical protein
MIFFEFFEVGLDFISLGLDWISYATDWTGFHMFEIELDFVSLRAWIGYRIENRMVVVNCDWVVIS